MAAAVTVSPPSQYTAGYVTVTGTGGTSNKNRVTLDGVVVYSSCTSTTLSAQIQVGTVATTSTINWQQYVSGVWTTEASTTVVVWAAPSSSSSPIVVTTNNQTIENLTFAGTLPTIVPASLGSGVSTSGSTAASPITNLIIRKCTFSGFRLAIYLQFVTGLTIEDCVIEDADYAGIALFSCINVTVQRNTIRRIGYVKDPTSGFQGNNAYGIMFNRTESNSLVTDPVCQNVTCTNNVVEWVPLWMGINSHAGNTISITNNTVRHCPRGIFVAGSPTPPGTTQPVAITVDSNQLHDSVTKTGGSSDKTGVTYDSWTGTSVQHNRVGSSFNNITNTDGLSTGVTVSDNTTSGT